MLGCVLEGKGVPSNLLEALVLRPVTRRKEPLQQFLETPYCRTVGARRVSSLSISTGPNPLSDLGADVKKELIAKREKISIRKAELNEWAEKRENKWRERREVKRKKEKRSENEEGKKRRRTKKRKSGT